MTRPVLGSPDWGDDLNADLDQIEAKAVAAQTTATNALSAATLMDQSHLTAYAARRAQDHLLGSGARHVSTGGSVRWDGRFIALGDGVGAHWSANGFFAIDMPPNGTVIPGLGATPSVTVDSFGIYLAPWDSLWYIPPVGSGGTSLSANFRVRGYFDVGTIPSEWIKIAQRHADEPVVKWGDGTVLPLGSAMETQSAAYYGGNGFPEGVVSAPFGSTYIDFNWTAGSVLWIKYSPGISNTGWKIFYGDTGWRSSSAGASFFLNTAGPGSDGHGYTRFRRIGHRVDLTCAVNIPGAWVNGTAFLSIPLGFRRTDTYVSLPVYATAPESVVNTGATWLWYGTTGNDKRFSVSWVTDDAWPTVNPGV